MSDENGLLEPPVEAIETGYSAMLAHQYLQETNDKGPYGKGIWYLNHAIHCLPMALDEVNKVLKEAGKKELFHHVTGKVERLLGHARVIMSGPTTYEERWLAGAYAKEAHAEMSAIMEDNGFRDITDRDFVRLNLGDGGGR